MRQLTVRNIDERLYRRLCEAARANRRSLASEVRAILDQAVLRDRADVARRAAAMRTRLASSFRGDVTADIRNDRER
ncbi:MAG: hypothetical protein WEB85_15870 [Dongiaceae bacterium]